MKKWLLRILIAAALVALPIGVLYELSTHVGRGWLKGEAFFDGRPTSYWRLRCDEFLGRSQTPLMAAAFIPRLEGAKSERNDPDFEADFLAEVFVRPAPKSVWTHWAEYLGFANDNPWDRQLPEVLRGTPEAEAVLIALNADEKYKVLTARALRNVKVFKEMQP